MTGQTLYETCRDHDSCVRITTDDEVEHRPARKGHPLDEIPEFQVPEIRRHVLQHALWSVPGVAALVWLLVERLA